MKMPFLLLIVFIGLPTSLFAQETDAPKPTPTKQEQEQDDAKKKSRDVHRLRPQHPTDELLVMADKSIQDGFAFLVKTQNEDGSWGSHDPKIANLANFGFQLRHRGSQDAVRTACTAICAEALLNQPNRTEEQQAALDKAISELLKERKFAFHPGESFNTWGYGYKLGFLAALYESPEGEQIDEEELRKAMQSCVDGLVKFSQHQGGWGYYSGVMNDFQSMSFNTAFFALSLKRASEIEIGLEVPEGLIVDAAKIVDKQRAPDGSMAYDSRFLNSSQPVLGNLGAGSRTISSTLALKDLGFYGEADMDKAMEVFFNSENYLEQGRKLIQPHSAVHQISGYFFFFGYNYASEAAEKMRDRISQKSWDRFGWTMLRTQESDGCWWDTPAANYGDKWGTGFAIQTLQRFVRETRRRKAVENAKSAADNDEESRSGDDDRDD